MQLFDETSYGLKRLVTDLDQLRLRNGFTSLFGQLSSSIPYPRRLGFFYEVEAAASLQRFTGKPVEFLGKVVTVNGKKVTDIDVVVDGVYVQVKRSGAALKSSWDSATQQSITSTKPEDWITYFDAWVGKAKVDMAAAGLPVKIRYYLPTASEVPQEILDHMSKLRRDFDIDFVFANDLSRW